MANQGGRRPDPLTVVAVIFGLAWLVFALLARPIGDYGVETDFFGDLRWAHRWFSEGPTLMNGFRGPLYPLVLGALAAVVRDGFLAGKLLSVVAAAAGLRILGGLVRGLFGSAAALGAVLFAAAAPRFIDYTFRAGTDMVFWALFVSVLTLLFATDERPSVRKWAAAGALAGAAWLTRANGLLLVPVAAIVAVTVVRPRSRSWKVFAVFVLAMLAVASPWLAFVAVKTGNPFWSNSYKLVAASIYGPSPGLAQQGELAGTVGFASLSEALRVDPARVLAFLPAQIVKHLRGDVLRLAGIVPAVIAAAGVAAGIRSRAWTGRRSTAFWISGAVVFAGMLPVFYNPRFMLPLLIWWAAAAGGLAHAAASRRAPRRWPATAVLVLLLGLMGWNTVSVVRRSLDPRDPASSPAELVELARIAERRGLPFGPRTPIAARKPQIGYLLNAPVVPVPEGGVDALRTAGVHYLLVSAVEVNRDPLLAPLLRLDDPDAAAPGLRLVASVVEPLGDGLARGARLFAVENPRPWSPPAESSPVTVPDTEPGLDRIDTLRLRLARWYLLWAPEPEPEVDRLLRLMGPEARHHASVLALEGDATLMEGDAVDAVRLYRRSLVADPDRSSTYLRLVGARLLSEPDVSARELLQHPAAHLEVAPGDSTASWWTIAAPYLAEGTYAAAIAPLTACIEAAPDNAACRRYLGLSLMALGWRERAAVAFRRCLEISPDDTTARDALRALEAGLARDRHGPG